MKTIVISYSLTGNNDSLAAGIANELSASHMIIEEPKPRTMGTIAFDMLFNRKPKINEDKFTIDHADFIIIVGPVWMGKVASPLRPVLKKIKKASKKYAFVSISGGADGPNPKLGHELTKKSGSRPVAVIDMHIADLFPPDSKPTREDTSSYRLKEADINVLKKKALQELYEFTA
jgi:flavodoxin